MSEFAQLEQVFGKLVRPRVVGVSPDLGVHFVSNFKLLFLNSDQTVDQVGQIVSRDAQSRTYLCDELGNG